eukprot:CAMPEP_0181231586 /NCGR_PEP_ID=MMETSP1096-20121128/35199_1 /TAXON_ID=156174 ORGANISM="Chrysochromulina ericina, Strain CCMP281" /NCGR_SAMPLE_ID=MMETSP1096 /ASSEMBLY_ACC=CAM_ASM_000453 /LENGTH=148 /DNA_ID=CAMNT_0023325665 /DNA_START=295 /DNA_END=741 /DNA_ORIENTATION=+
MRRGPHCKPRQRTHRWSAPCGGGSGSSSDDDGISEARRLAHVHFTPVEGLDGVGAHLEELFRRLVQQSVGVCPLELQHKPIIVAIGVDEADGTTLPHPQLPRARHFPQLIPRPRASWKRDEAVSALSQCTLPVNKVVTASEDELEALE